MTQQVPPGAQPGHENPRAAAKAYAKASRPWFKKKRYILLIIVVVIIAIALSTSGGEGDEPEVVGGSPTSQDDGADKAGTKSNPIAVGDTVKLQGTQYTVKGVKTAATVGSEYFQETAGGVYVIVELTIENTKDETKTFSDSAARFIGGNGKSYSTDTDGTIAAIGDDGEPLFLEDMQPDVPKTGILVFDVPEGSTSGSLLEVSDLFGRGSAYIELGLD